MTVTVEQARMVQRDFGLSDRHVVYLDEGGFAIAHSNWEREHLDDLRTCSIHAWLYGGLADPRLLSCCYPAPGWYLVSTLHETEALVF